jgi:hypothetical protein
MCCFSRAVTSVTDTSIFARGSGGRQFLAYGMRLDAKEELAMILPIPVAAPTGADPVTFLDLEDYPRFFHDLALGIQPLDPSLRSMKSEGPVAAPLPVVDVGHFEASFVPTVADFGRLDERFRIADGVWSKIPRYSTYGFVVFKLKPGATGHPMAFSFASAEPDKLFFPTMHIHDGDVHETAAFDHHLYCQRDPDRRLSLAHWNESPALASSFMRIEQTRGIVDAHGHCYMKRLFGTLANEDQLIGA